MNVVRFSKKKKKSWIQTAHLSAKQSYSCAGRAIWHAVFELKEWTFWTPQIAVSTKLGREMISINTCIMRNDPSPLVSEVSLMYSCRDLPAKTKRDLIQRKKRWRVHKKYYKNKIQPLVEYFKQKCASFVFWAGTAGRGTACEDRLWAGSLVPFVIVWGKFRRCAREKVKKSRGKVFFLARWWLCRQNYRRNHRSEPRRRLAEKKQTRRATHSQSYRKRTSTRSRKRFHFWSWWSSQAPSSITTELTPAAYIARNYF